jgi:hypothetical protein
LHLLADQLNPKPSNVACYNNFFRLSIRYNSQIKSRSMDSSFQFSPSFCNFPDEVFSASHYTAEATLLGVINPSYEFFRQTIHSSLAIFLNCCFQLNQQHIQSLLTITTLQAL